MRKRIEGQSGNPHELRGPWSPTGIAVVSLLLSPLPGGVLHALNYARLGHPERKRLVLFSNLITGTAVLFIPALLPGTFSRPAAAFLIAAYFYKSQEQLFQAYCSQGSPKASLLKPVVLSVVLILVLVFILYVVEWLVAS